MKTKLFLMCVMAASAAYSGAAMPTEAEVEKAVPKVERMLASEKVALASGKMTRAEVAAAAMKLVAGADDEAAKLLLMKGAFILHVKDGDLEKAVKTMNALETAIADIPPQIVTNIIETALLGMPDKAANGARLYQLLDATKATAKRTVADGENLKVVVEGYTWTYSVKNGEAMIVSWKNGRSGCAVSPKPTGDVAIPSTLGGAKVTGIGQGALAFCPDLDYVTIPDGVKTVGTYALGKCGGLKSVSMPSSVTVIGNASFCYCSKLESVAIPKNVVSIWDFAFIGCGGLKSIEIPDRVRNIGKRAFYGCSGLTSVTMRGERPDAKEEVFGECSNLKAIHVPANAKSWAGMTEWQGIPLVFDGETK